jgi:sigma-B regulation protein RsbU (phosphoserine phosphatase)
LWTRVAQNADRIHLPIGKGIAGTVAATGTTINIKSAYNDPRFDPENDVRSGYKTTSMLCMPLINSNGVVVGVIQALNRRSEVILQQGDMPAEDDGTSNIGPFSSYDEQVLAALCSQAAVAIDNAQLLERDRERQALAKEMELARQIQLSLLPSTVPERKGWRFAAWAKSCDQTGGDYYDFLVKEDALDVVIGDVSGHGLGAAMLMSTARAFLRALDLQSAPLADIVTSLNRLLEQDMAEDAFMTMLVCRIDDQGSCTYVAAGHEPPMIFRAASKSFDALDSTGLPLGMIDDAAYEMRGVGRLERGDIMVLFTDGIFEAQQPGSAPWGLERMQLAVQARAAQGAKVVCDHIIQGAMEHLNGVAPHDDMTLVVVERR